MAASRREFIFGSGALLLSASFVKISSGADKIVGGFDTVIVGAGPAGLSAARELVAAGKSVIVIEARQRIGGRMWTDHSFSQHVPIELGAELIHGGPAENSIWEIITKNGIATNRTKKNLSRYSPDSRWVSTNEDGFYAFPLYLPPRPKCFKPLKSDCNAEVYLNRLGIEKDNRPLSLLATTIDREPFEKMRPSEIIDEVSRLWQDASDRKEKRIISDDFKVTQGYDGILTALSEGLHIQLDTVVTRIHDNGSSVLLTAIYNNEHIQFSAKNCVVTIPAPVLLTNKLEFIPPLPRKKMDALHSGRSVPVVKIIMEFDQKVFPLYTDRLDDFSQLIPCIWNASSGIQDYQGQILVGWSTGDNARKLLSLTEIARYEHMLQVVRDMTGKADLRYQKAIIHDWSRDSYSMGAYGFWDNEECILEPVGNIYWAGVVLSQVNYAYDSGVKTAKMILKKHRPNKIYLS
ncbi:flavin monoamine oxidase family protein [Enterobacter kobei]|uniref:flavin monoamine oxidase family protein n=1 Tax=Enterobacter kobei TaxID=208224 RepID=UPI003ED9DB21